MKRKLLLPIVLVLVAAVGLATWAIWQKHRSNTIILADGSKLEYLGATMGANCSFNYGTLWQRLVPRLPRRLAQKIGGGIVRNAVVNAGYSGDSSVVFWFVRHGGPIRAKPTNVVYKFASGLPTYAIGGGGFTYGRSGPSVMTGLAINLKDEQGDGVPGLKQLREAVLPSGDSAVFWRTDVVPSASQVIFLRVYECPSDAGWICIGELEIPNPHRDATR